MCTPMVRFQLRAFVCVLFFLFACAAPMLSATGEIASLRGTVSDPSGAVVPGTTVRARNLSTGAVLETTTGAAGVYLLPLPAGIYEVQFTESGFQETTRRGIDVSAGGVVALDVQLQLATQSESLSVTVELPGVETTSSQIGNTISAAKITAIPLNGRSFTDLLAMQPGVIPASSQQPNAVVMSGCTATPPSGDLNPGNLSVSGQRETSNGFAVNGSGVEEDFNNGTAIAPNLDSIQDLKVLTSNFDAEYGNYSGGQVLVTTKSGGNKLHGSAFEFLRNTALDSRNYLAPDRATYERNQYGGTLGGPIRKDKSFFFVDYQGTKMTQGQETGNITVPSADAISNGNLSNQDMAKQLVGAVSTDYWASQLSAKLGLPSQLGHSAIYKGEPYYTPGCTDYSQCVFPGATVSKALWSAPATFLRNYIPKAVSGSTTYSDSSQNETLGDNKAAARFDTNLRFGNLSAYYFFDQYNLDNPYPTAEGGANVPGFSAASNGRAQLLSLSLTKAFGAKTVNEAHFSYMRDFNVIGKPVGGVGPSLNSQGFKECDGSDSSCLGIVPLNKSIEGIENVAFNDYTIGVDVTGERQVNNTFQWSDNFSRLMGHHTLKIGGSFHLDQVNIQSNSINNGSFVFQGTETGSDFADFLLGVASTYEQGDAGAFYIRNKYVGVFAQDSWQVRPNLVLNYGLRWDVLPPWHEKYNQLQTFVLGQQSVVYPGAPTGIVFPGDSGIPRTLAPTKWDNFSPRLGLTYSPSFDGGLPGKIFGSSGKSSIHAGFGFFYSAFEGLSAGIMSACAPYGYDYDSTNGQPSFGQPFLSATTGAANGQPFPSPIPVFGASASRPNTSVAWSKYEPITGDPAFYYRNTSPYTESYNLSFERELARNTYLMLGYVGSQAHHLLVLTSANPGNPALCLSTPGCGPFDEGTIRGPFGPDFAGITYQKTLGFSNYNSFEATLRHTTKTLELMAAYTYGKSLDDSSSLSEPVYPMGAALSKAISAFDLRHNFVVSYRYALPLDRLAGKQNRLTTGWSVSGITRFSTGLPVTLYNNTDNSLLGSMPNRINNNGVDTPIMLPGNLHVNTNPRGGRPAFNTSLFPTDLASPHSKYLGQLGNVPRRFFYGPGLENFDMALQKEVALHEGRMLQLRVEGFNVFNHGQFFGPAAVNGNISSGGFGEIVNAMPPRQVQLAAKFIF